ncbi:MAG: Holliday junction resolvase RuvX [Endomicrobiia bacterium]|nr:Holliday junction resolvase RuvX [Endomicrobiia bacterium]
MGRILSIDYGLKIIGIAVSDALGMTAQPLASYHRLSVESDIKHIRRLAEEYSVDKIVVGLPVHLDGRESALSSAVREFGRLLSEGSAAFTVEYFDERMTTSLVERMLIEEADVSRAKRKKVKDKLAAALILQNYLDSKSFVEEGSS